MPPKSTLSALVGVSQWPLIVRVAKLRCPLQIYIFFFFFWKVMIYIFLLSLFVSLILILIQCRYFKLLKQFAKRLQRVRFIYHVMESDHLSIYDFKSVSHIVELQHQQKLLTWLVLNTNQALVMVGLFMYYLFFEWYFFF